MISKHQQQVQQQVQQQQLQQQPSTSAAKHSAPADPTRVLHRRCGVRKRRGLAAYSYEHTEYHSRCQVLSAHLYRIGIYRVTPPVVNPSRRPAQSSLPNAACGSISRLPVRRLHPLLWLLFSHGRMAVIFEYSYDMRTREPTHLAYVTRRYKRMYSCDTFFSNAFQIRQT